MQTAPAVYSRNLSGTFGNRPILKLLCILAGTVMSFWRLPSEFEKEWNKPKTRFDFPYFILPWDSLEVLPVERIERFSVDFLKLLIHRWPSWTFQVGICKLKTLGAWPLKGIEWPESSGISTGFGRLGLVCELPECATRSFTQPARSVHISRLLFLMSLRSTKKAKLSATHLI